MTTKTEGIEDKLIEYEQELIRLKTGANTSADSSMLYRLFFDFSDVQETREYRIEVAPVKGDYDNLIVMPIGSTGAYESIVTFNSGMGLDFSNPCVLHFKRYYEADNPGVASSFMVYSNAELYVKSQSYVVDA